MSYNLKPPRGDMPEDAMRIEASMLLAQEERDREAGLRDWRVTVALENGDELTVTIQAPDASAATIEASRVLREERGVRPVKWLRFEDSLTTVRQEWYDCLLIEHGRGAHYLGIGTEAGLVLSTDELKQLHLRIGEYLSRFEETEAARVAPAA